MGYYEQTGVANLKREQRRAAMHPLRRRLGDGLLMAFLCGVSLLLWLALLAPLWLLLAG